MLTALGDKPLLETIIHAPRKYKSVGGGEQLLEPAVTGLCKWLEIEGCCAQGLRAQLERLLKVGDLFVADGVLQVSSVAYKRYFESSRVRRPASAARQDTTGRPPRSAGRATYKGPSKKQRIKGGVVTAGDEENPCRDPWRLALAGVRLDMQPPEPPEEVLFGTDEELSALVTEAAPHCGTVPACFDVS